MRRERLPCLVVKEAVMRLDKFLKVSRLIKRRTVANEACDAGRVSVNGQVAKASVKVKVGAGTISIIDYIIFTLTFYRCFLSYEISYT